MINVTNTPTIKVKKMNINATLPTRGSEEAAGIDLYACIDEPSITIMPGETYLFDIGIGFDIPEGYFGAIFVRSSIGIKKHLRLSNSVPIIDNDYKGSVKIELHNFGDTIQIINNGDRIAQMVLLPYTSFPIEEVEELTETKRGEGGIGSTGR